MSDNAFALSLDAMKAWCDRNEVTFLFNERLQQLAIPTPLGPEVMVRVVPRPSRRMMTFALVLPLRVPDARQAELARACALANSSTFMGAWVLNSGNGELYFRLTVPTGGVSYEDEGLRFLLQVVIGTAKGMMDRFRAIALEGASWDSLVSQPGAPEA